MTKVVILDAKERMCAHVIGPTGAEHRRLANKVMEEALKQANLAFNEISYVLATGYGRINVPFADSQKTELTCHARGIASFFPDASAAIDIGGQDAKGLKIKNGKLVDFVMNDRCAAGTGRFLEILAKTLDLKVEELGAISKGAVNKIPVSSTCTVFAEHEVMSYLSRGAALADIVAGLHDAIASRVVKMIKRLEIKSAVVFTGGVAKNAGVVDSLKESLGVPVLVPEDPLLTGAIGAALLGKEIIVGAMDNENQVQRKERRLERATLFSE